MKKIDFVFYAVIAGLAVAAPIIAMQPKAATVTVDPGETLTEGVYDLVPQAPPAPPDTDGDGVPDPDDACPTVPAQTPDGCPPPPPPDADNDGVEDAIDQCPGTPEGAPVDATGCEFDSDGDGVVDSIDQCPGTPAGDTVDSVGCTVVPPPPPPPVTGITSAIIAMAAPQHQTQIQTKKIPGSEINVLVGSTEFPFCQSIKCYNSWKAFNSYTGAVWNWNDFSMLNFRGGGHSNYGGNEIYRLQLGESNGTLTATWSRPRDPTEFIDGLCGSPIGNPTEQAAGTAFAPEAAHTYAGDVYVESRDEYFLTSTMGYTYGTAACPGEDHTPSRGGYISDGVNYSKVFDKTVNGTVIDLSYPRSCYLSDIDKIITFSPSKAWMIDPQAGYQPVAIPKVMFGYSSVSGNFDTATDGDICYAYVKGHGIWGVDYAADGSGQVVFKSTTKEWPLGTPAMDVDPQTGDLVIIGEDGYGIYIDKETKTETDISAPTGVVGDGYNKIMGKFSMVPDAPCVGIVVFGSDASNPQSAHLLTLPANVCSMTGQPIVVEPPTEPPVVDPPPPAELVEAVIDPGYIPSSLSFEERCHRPGVVFCDPLSDQAPRKIIDGVTTLLKNPDGTEGLYFDNWWRKWRGGENYEQGGFAEYDPQVGALKITRTETMQTKGGAFMTHFSDIAGENAFDLGDTFSVEFDVLFSCEMVYKDCDPASPTYKTDRAGLVTSGGREQGFKIVILSEGNYAHGFEARRPATACQISQHVIQNNFGTLASFNDCGKYLSHAHVPKDANGKYLRAGGSYQYDRQTGKDFTCYRFPTPLVMRDDGKAYKDQQWNYVGPDCAMIEADEWITLRMHLSVGEFNGSNNLFQMFVAYGGEPLKEVTRWNSSIRDPGQYPAFGAIHFTQHSTNSIAQPPTRTVWYRNLIVLEVL